DLAGRCGQWVDEVQPARIVLPAQRVKNAVLEVEGQAGRGPESAGRADGSPAGDGSVDLLRGKVLVVVGVGIEAAGKAVQGAGVRVEGEPFDVGFVGRLQPGLECLAGDRGANVEVAVGRAVQDVLLGVVGEPLAHGLMAADGVPAAAI